MGEHTLKALPDWQPPQWPEQLDDRTRKHIAFARQYAAQFAHGAPGHLDLMTIAALAKLLDQYHTQAMATKGPILPLEEV
jgi:hypothetical protein